MNRAQIPFVPFLFSSIIRHWIQEIQSMHLGKTYICTYLTEDSSRHVLIEQSDDDPRVLTLQDKINKYQGWSCISQPKFYCFVVVFDTINRFNVLMNTTNLIQAKTFCVWSSWGKEAPIKGFFVGHESFLWGHWYPCFGLLLTSALGFKAMVDSLACTLPHLCTTDSSDSPLVWHLLTV